MGQSLYQSGATFVLYYAGPHIFHYTTDEDVQQLSTLVFNTYVWMQIFNMYKYVVKVLSLCSQRLSSLLTLYSTLVVASSIELSTYSPVF